MPRPSNRSAEQKLRVVLSVLGGEQSAAGAGRKAGAGEQSVHNWKRLLVESGREGLAGGRRRRTSREVELEAENEELKAALGEAHVELRVWRKGGSISPRWGPRDDPHRRGHAHHEVRGCGRRAPTDLPVPVGHPPRRWPAERAVACAGGGSDRTGSCQAGWGVAGVGASQDLGHGPLRRPRLRVPVVGQAGDGPPGPGPADPLPGRAAPARQGPQSGLRRRPVETEPGMAGRGL